MSNSKPNFLETLQQKIPIQEGIEGFRSIFREIYRAGHISLFDLAVKTLLPLPVLAKIVNTLTESEILKRIPEGILYSEKGMLFIEKELGLYGFGLGECNECDQRPVYLSPRWDDVLDTLEAILSNRPTVDTSLDQAFADAETSLQRALYLYQKGALEGKRVCLLGDDDFTSVAIAACYRGFFPDDPHMIPLEMVVVDIDDRILEGIQSSVHKIHPDLTIHSVHWDYRTLVPKDLLARFDTILIDPPYSENGLILGISRAVALLRAQPGAEIYLSFAHRSPEQLHQIEKHIIDMGLSIQEIIPRFNYYEGAQLLGNTTQMIRLISTQAKKPLISPSEEFTQPLYTGENKPNFRIYFCKQCQKGINVGATETIHTIEQLKSEKCPYCQSSGPFVLDQKISQA
jgi:hypothetical protein